jgi:hypothetical protein
MKYSFVLAALSAAAIAHPYVNVEISDDVVATTGHGVQHHRSRDHHDSQHRGWFSGLWSGRNRSRNGRDRSRNGRDRSDDRDDRDDRDNRRDDRDNRDDRRDDDREDRDDRDDHRDNRRDDRDNRRDDRDNRRDDRDNRDDRRDDNRDGRDNRDDRRENDRRENNRDDRRNDRDDRRNDRDNNGDDRRDHDNSVCFLPESVDECGLTVNQRDRNNIADIIDDIVGDNAFECVINGRSNREERRQTERCCERNGGELNDQEGHCKLNKNLLMASADIEQVCSETSWRTPAMTGVNVPSINAESSLLSATPVRLVNSMMSSST